ncbi:MAG: hypothetical protein HeimC3_01310 [Candidatus Heimdallarchaeota archaeon LC_3]|nr:MAG: hypothetical protein HeimC3_01310 [Candidatus Heimdallarchaeota archaeon LC_3]
MTTNETVKLDNVRITAPSPKFLVFSFFIASTLSILIYWGPYFDWYYLWLESTTRDFVVLMLNISGVSSNPSIILFPMIPEYELLGEASLATPGVWIPGSQYENYWIIKACTGMQAGAILASIILVTPIPNKTIQFSSFKQSVIGKQQMFLKVRVIIIFLIVLFLGNVLRIWFELYLVGALNVPFEFAEGELAKPIGFVGTLIFAWLIEKQGVHIIDTFADWLSLFYNSVKKLVLIIFRQNRSVTTT